MTRSQLIKWSIARDALNLIGIGQIPGLCWVFDLPLIVIHFNYAGPAAVFTLLEAIPIVGFFPFFTIAAMMYPDRDTSRTAVSVKRVEHTTLPQMSAVPAQPPLYTIVDGRLIPVEPVDQRPFIEEASPRH